MERWVRITFPLILCLFLAGCYEVKRTDGLRAAYERILLANYLAVEVRERKDLPENKRKLLIDSYATARSSVNSFLDDVTEKSANAVDIPLSIFYRDKASDDLNRFISDVIAAREKPKSGQEDKIREEKDKDKEDEGAEEQKQKKEESEEEKRARIKENERSERERLESQRKEGQRFESVLTDSGEKIKKILDLNREKGKDPYKRFRSLVDELRMVEFSRVSK